MRETKVNLKHLLEDIRDSYTIPLEEIILVELVANSLDSGASRVSLFSDPQQKIFTVLDNGKGMRREALTDYHNIAATTKMRGRGIGFAGVGAKLSLLMADYVLTQTKGGRGSRCATQWHLKNETSAPWKFVPFAEKVPSPRGTSVSIVFQDSSYPLLSEEFIQKTLRNHFFPLFYPAFFQLILKHIYKKGVEFFINGRQIIFEQEFPFEPHSFQIRVGGGSQKLAGVGFLAQQENQSIFPFQGVAISTFGKVIKSGWEWLGVNPRQENAVCGMIEIPILAEILTTNKMDFLKDSASLKKYYYFRKAIQEAILPLLESFGQIAPITFQRNLKGLANEIERTLRQVLNDFPELLPLLGIQKTKKSLASFAMAGKPLVEMDNNDLTRKEKLAGQESDLTPLGEKNVVKMSAVSLDGAKPKKSKKGPALAIGFEDWGCDKPLSKMIEDKIWVNTLHPAYLKAKAEGLEQYHIIFATGWALSAFVQDDKSPQDFLNAFLASWGNDQNNPKRLFV